MALRTSAGGTGVVVCNEGYGCSLGARCSVRCLLLVCYLVTVGVTSAATCIVIFHEDRCGRVKGSSDTSNEVKVHRQAEENR
jgi:hypothetical protein